MIRPSKTAAFALVIALGASVSALPPQTPNRVTNNNVTNDVLRRAGTAAATQSGSWLSYGKRGAGTRTTN